MSPPTAPSFDPTQLLYGVARAILSAATDDQGVWEDLEQGEREDFLFAANAAIAAHDGWLKQAGFKIIPPGAVHVPESDDEARAMMQAVRAFQGRRDRKKTLLTRPALIVPRAN